MTPDIYSKAIIDKVCNYLNADDSNGLSEYISFSKNLMGNATYRILERAALSTSNAKEFKVALGAGLAGEINTETLNTHHLREGSMGHKIGELDGGSISYHHRDRLKMGLELLKNTGLSAPLKSIKAMSKEVNSRLLLNPQVNPFEIGMDIAMDARGLIMKGVVSDMTLINTEQLVKVSSAEIGIPSHNNIIKQKARI